MHVWSRDPDALSLSLSPPPLSLSLSLSPLVLRDGNLGNLIGLLVGLAWDQLHHKLKIALLYSQSLRSYAINYLCMYMWINN